MPAIEHFANMDVHSSSDGFDDTSFDDLDMDAFMDIYDDNLDMIPDIKPPPKKPTKLHPPPSPKKKNLTPNHHGSQSMTLLQSSVKTHWAILAPAHLQTVP